jgi:hypothetical protein
MKSTFLLYLFSVSSLGVCANTDSVSTTHQLKELSFKTNNKKFSVTVTGKIGLVFGYDIGNNLYNQSDVGLDFLTNAIPIPAKDGHKSDMFINASNSLDFIVKGFAESKNEITGHVRIKTNGLNHSLNLNKAYANYRNITFGLKSTMMKDIQAVQPPTIDPQGPSGSISANVYELNYTSQSYNGFKFAIGMDMPSFYSSSGIYRGKDYPIFYGIQVANYADAEQMIPDFPMWIEYSLSQWNRIRFSSIVRNFAYKDLVKNKIRREVGYGIMLSGNIQPIKPIIFYYQACLGNGIGNYIQDLAGQPLSFIPQNNLPGKMTGSQMAGFNLGLTYNICNKLQTNFVASQARVWGVSDYCNAPDSKCNYKYALYFAGNIFYNITPYLQYGIEYLLGHRQNWKNEGANDNRIQTQLMFTF